MTDNNDESVIIDVGSMDLRNKVTVTENGVDPAQLEKAESIIANMADSYLDWAMEDAKKLQLAYVDLIQHMGQYQEKLRVIFEIAHDMKGQGGSFGYDLVTDIGTYLCRFVERIKSEPTQKILDVIKLHIDAISMVLMGKIKGDGGEKGAKIVAGLEATLEKYMPDLVENLHHLKEEKERQAAEQAQQQQALQQPENPEEKSE